MANHVHHKFLLSSLAFVVFCAASIALPAQQMQVLGGTLSWTATTVGYNCPHSSSGQQYSQTSYTSFSWNYNNIAYPVSGSASYISWGYGGAHPPCPPEGPSSPVQYTVPSAIGFAANCSFSFAPTGSGSGTTNTQSCGNGAAPVVGSLTLSNPTTNAGVQLMGGGSPALVPLGNGQNSKALQLVYVNTSQDVALAYSINGLTYYNVGSLSVPGHTGNVAELDCTPAYSDHCGVAAAALNGNLYVAYNDISCNCLHVLEGTVVPNQTVFTWTDVYDDTAHQLVATPEMLVVPNGSHFNLIVRYGTTSGTHEAYSSVLNGATGEWSTQDSNSTSRTQSTLFTMDGNNYAIDIDNDDNTGALFITELDDNGVAISGTTNGFQGYDSVNIVQGFSSAVYSSVNGNCALVTSMPPAPASTELQVFSTLDYYDFAAGEFWGNQTLSNFQMVGYNGFYGDFATAVYPPQPSASAQIVIVYRGDSNGDLYATSGNLPVCEQ